MVYGSVNHVLADHCPAVLYDVVHFRLLCKEYLTLVLKNFRLLFSAVISEHFSKNRMIISVVAAKIWYLKNVRFLLGHPVKSTALTTPWPNHELLQERQPVKEQESRHQCVYEGPIRSAEKPTLAPQPQHVYRQSGCEVVAIFENVKNIRYRYLRLRLHLINLNFGSI